MGKGDIDTDLLSPRMSQLIRVGAERLLQAPDAAFRELDRAVLSVGSPAAPESDLVESARRSNRAHLLRWATANVRAPGSPVAPEQGEDVRSTVRDLARRGLGDRALHAYRVGQNVAWRHWMAIAFTLTDDPAELRELLDLTSRSLSDYIDTALEAVTALIADERDRLTRSVHAERLDLVAAILREAAPDPVHAEARLDYRLDGPHTAAVIHCASPSPQPGVLEDIAHLLATSVRMPPARKPLAVLTSPATLWTWLPSAHHPDATILETFLNHRHDIRVAIGTTASGLAGFRHSHSTAKDALRLLETATAPQQVADYDHVQAVVLATRHLSTAHHLVDRVLGPLARYPDLCATLRAHFANQGNASATARQLFLHRNTVLGRLTRAERLLPQPLSHETLNLALALEIHRWFGYDPALTEPHHSTSRTHNDPP